VRTFYRPRSRWEPNQAPDSGSGSGVIIDPNGLIATNNHVISGAQRIIVTLQDRQEYDAEIIGIDPATDLALLKIDAEKLPYLRFGDSDSLHVGEFVLAIGNPFKQRNTVTHGIVSAKGRSIDVLEGEDRIESFIQTDAAVNPGNSGGALVNDRGQLIGINTAIISKSGRNEGFAFAIPGNLARRILKDLRDFGEVERAVLGVYIQEINATQAYRLGLEETRGALITRLREGGAAEAAGLEAGDVHIGINNEAISSRPEMQEQISHYRPGDQVRITYIRNGKRVETELLLLDKNNSVAGKKLVNNPISNPLQDLGFDVRRLSPAEQNRLGTRGVRVTSVFRNSVIEKTNLRAGYLITEVNNLSVSSPDELKEILNSSTGDILLRGHYDDYEGDYYYQFER